jgi:glyoxylase-like metal-dependent hydrolase (beta-lactamase superfamily II)
MTVESATFGTIHIGDIAITYLPDGRVDFGYSVFPGTPDECWARHTDQTHDGRFVCSVGAFLIESGDQKILVDLGFGEAEIEIPDFASGRTGQLPQSLARAGAEPGDITTVVYTHMHSDHTGWTTTGDELTFANARHVAGPGEVAYWQENVDGAFSPAGQLAFASHFAEATDGEVLAPGVQVMHTPGHTPGHQIVVVSSGTERAMILGDTLHCAAQVQEEDMAFMFDIDPVRARQWRDQILGEAADTPTMIGASHLSGSAFGRVVTGDGKRYWTAHHCVDLAARTSDKQHSSLWHHNWRWCLCPLPSPECPI